MEEARMCTGRMVGTIEERAIRWPGWANIIGFEKVAVTVNFQASPFVEQRKISVKSGHKLYIFCQRPATLKESD
ncbi:hypothetical protein Fmac_007826 [Flemingia macrophylla]|uniref:Uncharacterized protein n=1 Tax=Flemingia macrophylla TaxID=520843 RepID=A0ABD1MW55_9FABA